MTIEYKIPRFNWIFFFTEKTRHELITLGDPRSFEEKVFSYAKDFSSVI